MKAFLKTAGLVFIAMIALEILALGALFLLPVFANLFAGLGVDLPAAHVLGPRASIAVLFLGPPALIALFVAGVKHLIPSRH